MGGGKRVLALHLIPSSTPGSPATRVLHLPPRAQTAHVRRRLTGHPGYRACGGHRMVRGRDPGGLLPGSLFPRLQGSGDIRVPAQTEPRGGHPRISCQLPQETALTLTLPFFECGHSFRTIYQINSLQPIQSIVSCQMRFVFQWSATLMKLPLCSVGEVSTLSSADTVTSISNFDEVTCLSSVDEVLMKLPLSAMLMNLPLSAMLMNLPLSAVLMELPLSAVLMKLPLLALFTSSC